MATTAQTAEIMFDAFLEDYESQQLLLDLTTIEEPDPSKMQKGGDWIWKQKEQHAPILTGTDLTGQETDIIQEEYPLQMGDVRNAFVKPTIFDLRTEEFWVRRGRVSAKRQASEMNQAIAKAVSLQGSQFYRSNTASGFDFIADAETLMDERQLSLNQRHFLLNSRDLQSFASDLAARQTITGRSEEAWKTNQIGENVAGFDLHRGNFLPMLAGGATPTNNATADFSGKPESGSIDDTTGVVTNVDWRSATIAVDANASYNIGDKVTFENSGNAVKAIGLDDKTTTGQDMIFTIVSKPTSTSVIIYPKPIAADDAALSTIEKAYANVDTQILNNADMIRQNIDASKKVNLFWDSSAIEIVCGGLPADLFKSNAGLKVLPQTMKNGQKMYMVYDGEIDALTFRFRIFTWYGITIANPLACGVAVTY